MRNARADNRIDLCEGMHPYLIFNAVTNPVTAFVVSIRRGPQAEQSPAEQSGIFLVDLDKLDEVFNSEVGKRHDAVFSNAVDPDDAILSVHFIGDVPQPIFVFAEVLSDASDCGDVMTC
jgi:hypothetical protein